MNGISTVFFQPLDPSQKPSIIGEGAKGLLKHLLDAESVELAPFVPLKVHFGEKGNQTFIKPHHYTDLIEYLASRNVQSAYIETNALYKGERQNRTSHLQLAEAHGFTQLPVIVADGEFGDEFIEVPSEGKHYARCLVAKEIALGEQLLVLSHFKGHLLSGFGGAVKQLAMGCSSRGGKLAQHSNAKPKMKPRKCNACGDCLEVCPAAAIILDPKPKIDAAKCLGCASCIAVCKKNCMSFSYWASFSKKFKERLAEYALAAHRNKNNIYLNFLLSVTRGCDCEGRKMKPLCPDIGILASRDPVALDSACLDLVQRSKRRKIFQRGRVTLRYAQEIGLGSCGYKLVEI